MTEEESKEFAQTLTDDEGAVWVGYHLHDEEFRKSINRQLKQRQRLQLPSLYEVIEMENSKAS